MGNVHVTANFVSSIIDTEPAVFACPNRRMHVISQYLASPSTLVSGKHSRSHAPAPWLVMPNPTLPLDLCADFYLRSISFLAVV
jgi:hypothetical protein